MDMMTLQHHPETGWSAPLPVALDGPRTLVLVFGPRSAAAEPAALDALSEAFAGSVRIGCSSAGEIAGAQIHDQCLSVAVLRFAHTDLRCACTNLADASDSEAAGARLAAQLGAGPPGLRAVLLLACGVDINGSALLRGLIAGLPDQVLVSGGLAGDDARYEQTWVLAAGPAAERHLLDRGVVAVGLWGDALKIGHGCVGGWQEFGPERRITGSDGVVLRTLDHQPAAALYRHYLGDLAADLPASALRVPLAVRSARGSGRPLVRTVMALDDAAQTLTFGGEVLEGDLAKLMRTSTDRLISAAEEAAQQALTAHDADGASVAQASPPLAQPVLALSVGCTGRRLIMGDRTEEEVEAVMAQLPPGSAHLGFYSYGEMAPLARHEPAEFHNQTMTVTVISERDSPAPGSAPS